jgi:hypothetical protein
MAIDIGVEIARLYVTFFDRAPDPDGFQYWMDRYSTELANGKDAKWFLEQIADSFAQSPEAKAIYEKEGNPSRAQIEAYITEAYQNLFDRTPDAEGLSYWAGRWEFEMANGRPGVRVLFEIENAARGSTNLNDVAALQNKAQIAADFSTKFIASGRVWGENDLLWSRNALDKVDHQADNNSKALLDNIKYFANIAPVAIGEILAANSGAAITYTAAQLLGNDTDADGDTLTIASVTAGTNGTVVLNLDGTVTFTPAANFSGAASFTYTVTDGYGTSAPATASVQVSSGGQTPGGGNGPNPGGGGDTTAPTATIGLANSSLKAGEITTVTVTFSEAVSGLDLSDFSAQNGTLSDLATTDNVTWTLKLTPNANTEDGTNAVTLATSYTDTAGNTGTLASSANYSVDTRAPTKPVIGAVAADNVVNAAEKEAGVVVTGTS